MATSGMSIVDPLPLGMEIRVADTRQYFFQPNILSSIYLNIFCRGITQLGGVKYHVPHTTHCHRSQSHFNLKLQAANEIIFFYLIWILVLSILRLNTPTKVGRESWSPLYINYVGSGPDPAVRRASAAASRKLLPTSSGTPGCSHQQPECTTIFAD